MAANRHHGGISIPRFEPLEVDQRVATGTPGVSVAAGAERLSRSLSRLGDTIGRTADRRAIEEGAADGAAAGLDPEFRRVESNTVYQRAFNQTGERAALARLDTQAREEMDQVFLEHGHDPIALEHGLKGLQEQLSQSAALQASPELAASFSAMFDRHALTYQRQTSRAVIAAEEASQRAAMLDWSQTRMNGLDRMAREAGLDPVADAALTEELGTLLTDLVAFGPREAFSVAGHSFEASDERAGAMTPEQITTLMGDAGRTVTEGRVMGAFTRTQGLDQLNAYREDFLAEANNPDGAYGDLTRADINRIDAAMTRTISRQTTALNAQRAGQERALDRALRNAIDVTDEGLTPGPDVFQTIMTQAQAIGATDIAAEAAEAAGIAQTAEWAWQQAPASLEAAINERRSELQAAGSASAFDARQLAALERVQANLATGLSNDPLSTAVRAGVVDVPPLTMSGEDGAASSDALAQSLTERAATARAVQSHYGLATPRFFTAAEAQQLGDVVAEGGLDRLSVAGVITEALGGDAEQALSEISSHEPALAHLGGLLTVGALPAASDLARGMELRGVEGWESRLPGANTTLRGGATIDGLRADEMGMFFQRLPRTAAAIGSAADQIYNARATRQGLMPDEFDTSLYRRALNEAAGAIYMADGRGREVQYGGFDTVRHGGTYALPAPSWLRSDRLTDAFNLLHDAEVLERLPDPPRAADGEAVTPAQISRAWFMPAGNGRYLVGFGRRDSDTPTLALNAAGEPYLLDLANMRDEIARRHPDWVR